MFYRRIGLFARSDCLRGTSVTSCVKLRTLIVRSNHYFINFGYGANTWRLLALRRSEQTFIYRRGDISNSAIAISGFSTSVLYFLRSKMAEFLELARVILERRESATSADTTTFHLNEHRCNRLWRNLRLHYNYYSGTLLYLQPTRLLPIFRDFYLIVTRADAIQQHFSSACSWLQAAVFQGNHRQAFQVLDQDLQECARSFRETTESLRSMFTSDLDAISRRYDDTESDAEMDSSNLRTRLQQFNSGCEKEKLLAEYIVARETTKSSADSDQDASLQKFFSLACHYPTSILDPIGGGSFGSVYKVEWLGMICAMKRSNASVDKNLMQESMKEVKTLALLNHPNIVKLLCVNSVTSKASFLMEYLPMSLLDYYKDRWENSEPISILATIDIMQQFARGMEYLHEQKIVHRDLKSSNILVAPSADEKLRREGYVELKIADLGSAKMKIRDLTCPTQDSIGTTKWRAPEVFHASSGPSDWTKADVYSFAMTCSEILTGEEPFKSAPFTKVLYCIENGERPDLASTCPEELRILLEQCWHNKPSRRPSFTDIGRRLASIKAAAITNIALAPIKLKLVEINCKSKTKSSPTTSTKASKKYLDKPILTCLTQAIGNKNTVMFLSSTFILGSSLIIVPFFTSWYQK